MLTNNHLRDIADVILAVDKVNEGVSLGAGRRHSGRLGVTVIENEKKYRHVGTIMFRPDGAPGRFIPGEFDESQ